ncbi:MAG: hypothetical protein KAX26_10835, partial [Anaerolineae bacterium]|nr:hypothetical protein [Anaerolineae bacterium]
MLRLSDRNLPGARVRRCSQGVRSAKWTGAQVAEWAGLEGGPDACPGDGAVVRKPTPAYSTLIPDGHLRRTAKTWVTARPFGFSETQRV